MKKPMMEILFSECGMYRGAPDAQLNLKQIASMKTIYGLPLRVSNDNPNHHLWNNNGVWWLHYTVYPTPFTSERIRKSLRTRSLAVARARRDELFESLRETVYAA